MTLRLSNKGYCHYTLTGYRHSNAFFFIYIFTICLGLLCAFVIASTVSHMSYCSRASPCPSTEQEEHPCRGGRRMQKLVYLYFGHVAMLIIVDSMYQTLL